MQVFFQFVERKLRSDRDAVIQHMKIRLFEINDPLTMRILHISIAYIPFPGDGPVKNLRATGHFMDLNWNSFGDAPQSFSKPIPP